MRRFLFFCLFLLRAALVQANDPDCLTLDQYLGIYGFQLSPEDSYINEGYMTVSQKNQFIEHLRLHPHIKKVAEIGLNAGHSAEVFFQNLPELEQFLSFDIQRHAYTYIAQEYLEEKYGERFQFVPGDSAVTVQEYANHHPDAKYDLIYIDGCHEYENVILDILNCSKLAHPDTILWIDDYYGNAVPRALEECANLGILQLDGIHHSSDPWGGRTWAQARYLFRDCHCGS